MYSVYGFRWWYCHTAVGKTTGCDSRVSQCAKSMKNYTLSPDSRLSCQVHYKKAKNFSFNANLGVPHDRSIIWSDFMNISLNKLQLYAKMWISTATFSLKAFKVK